MYIHDDTYERSYLTISITSLNSKLSFELDFNKYLTIIDYYIIPFSDSDSDWNVECTNVLWLLMLYCDSDMRAFFFFFLCTRVDNFNQID